MNNHELDKRFADMWQRSRYDAGKSQEYMAKALHVSKRTVQNWEAGITCPDQRQGFQWFRALGLQPLPYYLELLYPSEFHGDKYLEDDNLDDALCAVLRDLSAEEKRKILYCLSGTHGSSPRSVLELATAYLHLRMRDRIELANSIVLRHCIAEEMGDLKGNKSVPADIEMIRHAIRRATKAILNGEENYTSILED